MPFLLPSQRTSPFGGCPNKFGHEPSFVSDFDGELVVLRKFLQKRYQASQKIVYADKRCLVEKPELEEQGAEFVAQQIHRVHELLELRIAIYQNFFVCNDLWNFCRKYKSGRRLRFPS